MSERIWKLNKLLIRACLVVWIFIALEIFVGWE